MSKIHEMHRDIMNSIIYIDYPDSGYPYISGINSAAMESEKVTEQIAIEFTKFCLNKAKDLDTHTVYHNIDNAFQEFLKTK